MRLDAALEHDRPAAAAVDATVIAIMIAIIIAIMTAACTGPDPGGAARADRDGAAAARPSSCGTGTWRPGTLEIHHIDVGQGDSTLIVGPTGRALLIDAGEPRWDDAAGATTVGTYAAKVLGCAHLDQVLVTHFHVDHIGYPGRGGLWHLANVQGFSVGRLFHRDLAAYQGERGGTRERWRAYLAGEGRALLDPRVARAGAGQIDLGPGVTFTVVAVDGAGALLAGNFGADRAPPNENDYSIAAVLRFGKLDYFIGGDLSGEFVPAAGAGSRYTTHDVETPVARGLPDIDVYRVNHHGSGHSSGPALLAQMNPRVSIISAGQDNTHGHPWPSVLDRLAARGAVYMTERGAAGLSLARAKVGGHIVIRTADGVTYSVNGDAFLADDPPRVDRDGDGYFQEADPDDTSASVVPGPRGGCDARYQPCLAR